MNIKFYLKRYEPKPEPERGSLITAQMTFGNMVVRKSTGEVCKKIHWIGKTDKYVSQKADYYYIINQRLTKIRTHILDFFSRCRQNNRIPTKKELIAHYENFFLPTTPEQLIEQEVEQAASIPTKTNKTTTSKLTISDAIRNYQIYKAGTNDVKIINKDNYLRFFNQTAGYLEDFGLSETKVSSVDSLFLSDFSNSLFDAELEHNTVHAHFKRIKTVLNYCKDTLDVDVSKNYKEYKINYIEPDIVFLLPSEIDLLHKLKFSADEVELEQARDFFLFGCYVGARYGDLVSFNQANIIDAPKGKVLQYRPKKSKNTIVSIFLVNKALAILEKYPNEPKLLPFFKNDRINELIKPIAKEAGITAKVQHTTFAKRHTTQIYEKWERLTMHCSRHTFATVCFLSGMTELTVQRFLGHTKADTTKRYIHFAESFKSNAMQNAWATEHE
jgi:site-specific recombinase XerD